MKPIILIPARMASTRLPGKPLADIAGLGLEVTVLGETEMRELGMDGGADETPSAA